MQLLAVTAIVVLTLIASACGQTDQPTTTPNPGVDYGGICNGLLYKCNRHQETVLCMSKVQNDTIGGETCQTGAGVDVGRCQCRRNCHADTGLYEEDGEFDKAQDRCVGLVGKACSALNTYCTAHATCNLIAGKCACGLGYFPTPDGLRCQPTPTLAPSTTTTTTTETPPPTTAAPTGSTSPEPEPTITSEQTGSTTPPPEPTVKA